MAEQIYLSFAHGSRAKPDAQQQRQMQLREEEWNHEKNTEFDFKEKRKMFKTLFKDCLKEYEEISDIPFAKLNGEQWKEVKEKIMSHESEYKSLFPEYKNFSDVIDAEIYDYNYDLQWFVDALRRSANRPGVEEEYNYIKENLYMDEKTNIQLHGIWHILSEDEQKKIYNKKLWANLYYFFLTDKVFTEKTPVEILHDDDQPLYFDENRKKILSKREMARGTFTKFLEWQWLERYRYPSCEMDYIIKIILYIKLKKYYHPWNLLLTAAHLILKK